VNPTGASSPTCSPTTGRPGPGRRQFRRRRRGLDRDRAGARPGGRHRDQPRRSRRSRCTRPTTPAPGTSATISGRSIPLDVTEGQAGRARVVQPRLQAFQQGQGRQAAREVDPRPRLGRGAVGEAGQAALILLENVEEFRTWGPLDHDGQPIKERAGETFDKWCRELRRHGYKLQFRELRACDYGAPTIRKRFFMIARRDGLPIVWPEPTHGKPDSPEVLSGKRLPWRTAAEIIDWSIRARRSSSARSRWPTRRCGGSRTASSSSCSTIRAVHRPADASRQRRAQLRQRRSRCTRSPARTAASWRSSARRSSAAAAGAGRARRSTSGALSDDDGQGRRLPGRADLRAHRARRRRQEGQEARQGLAHCHRAVPDHLDVAGQRAGHRAHHQVPQRRDRPRHALPLATVTANSFVKRPGGCAPLGVVEAKLAPFVSYAQQGGLNRAADIPLHTVTASKKDHNCVVEAKLAPVKNGTAGQEPRAAGR
jgi:site-specific DNA-cytosine methylase